MSKIFPKINIKFHFNVITYNQTNEYMFSYYITTHFITSNKDYNSCRNPHLMYQTYPTLVTCNSQQGCKCVIFTL